MGFTLIASTGFAAGFSGGTTSPIDTTGATLIVVQESGAILGLTDSKGNTWIPLTARNISFLVASLRLFYCINPIVGSGHTFSTSGSSSEFSTINVVAFSSTGIVSFDAENGTNNVSSPATNGSISPAASDELFVVGLGTNGGPSATIDSSFIITNQEPYSGGVNFGGGLAYLISSGSSSQNPTWTVTGASDVASSMAAFIDAASSTVIERDLNDTIPFSDSLNRNISYSALANLLFEQLINGAAVIAKQGTCLMTFSFSQTAIPTIEVQGTALIEFDFSLLGQPTKTIGGTCEILFETEWDITGDSNSVPLDCVSKPEEVPSEIVGNLNVAYFT